MLKANWAVEKCYDYTKERQTNPIWGVWEMVCVGDNTEFEFEILCKSSKIFLKKDIVETGKTMFRNIEA